MIVSVLLILSTGKMIHAIPNELDVNTGPVRMLYDVIGHYALNYTGNTNHYDYWNTNGTGKLVSRNYNDRSDIVSENNSSALIAKSNDNSKIVKAYLVWESRSQEALKKEIQLVTPSQQIFNISSQIACKDVRMNDAGEEYVGVYTMATDVTSIICSDYGGYGTYTVANIPIWNGAGDGVACGGESVASWQLIVVEESPDFPLRTISLNLMSQYFYNVDYTVNVDFADASAPNGVVTAQFLDGTVDVDSDWRYDGIGYEDDHNYEYNGYYYRYCTQTRGLYKNGICFNDRDTGLPGPSGKDAVGGIRIHLFNDYRRRNSVGSQSTVYRYAGTGIGVNVFLFGVSIDVFSYNVKFDGNGATDGIMEDFACIYGRDYNLPENEFKRQYYQFAGWNTKPDGSGKSYKDKGYIYNLTSTEESVTLYAQWKKIGYQITLDSQGAQSQGTKEFYEWYGAGNYTDSTCTAAVSTITIPQKKSHSFGGYYTEKNGSGTQYIDALGNILSTADTFTKNTILYAKWTPAVYKITLENQGANTAGTAAYYEKYGVGNYTTSACTTSISKITVPAKNHYTFGGYYTAQNGEGQRIIDKSGNILKEYTLFDSDTTLYAYWEPVTYTISLDNQGANSTGSTAFYEVYGSHNYVSFNTADSSLGTVAQKFTYTGSAQIFTAPADGIYYLDVYGASGESLEYMISLSGSSGYLGKQSSGGWSSGTVSLKEGDILYIYVGGKGSGFTGGYNGGGDGAYTPSISSESAVLGGGGATDIRLKGSSLQNRIIVAAGGGGALYAREYSYYGFEGGSVKSSGNGSYLGYARSYNQTYSKPLTWGGGNNILTEGLFVPTVSSAGSGTVGTPFYEGTSDMLVSKYLQGSFGQGAQGGGGGYYGGSYLEVGTKEKSIYIIGASSGSSYIGGVSDGVIYGCDYTNPDIINSSGGQGNVTEYYDPALTLKANTGNGYAVVTYTNYSASTKVTNSINIPKRTGYVFGGYYTGTNGTGTCYVDASGNILSTPTTFTQNTTLYAKWTATSSTNNYKIQFNGNGADGGKMSLMTCNFNTSYKLTANAFTKTGYTFAGWSTTPNGTVTYGNQATVNNLSTTSGDVVVLYAKWTAANVAYKVNHYLENIEDGWSLWQSEAKSGKSDSSVSVSEFKKSKTGFTYSHAEVKGTAASSAVIAPDGSLTINLYYTRNTYTVTLNKGTGITATEGAGTYKYEDTVKINADVSKGYSWYAWSGTYYSTDKSYEFTMPAQNVDMTANTSPVIYKVTLDNQNPAEFGTMEYYEKYGIGNYAEKDCLNVLSEIILPKKTGYAFNGYYSGRNGAGTQYIDDSGKLLASSTAFSEDTTLYAYWTPVTYIVRFEGNGATGGSMSDFVCTYGVSSQLPLNEFVKTHYAFNCWNTKADGSGINYVNGSFIENLTDIQNGVITLYAVWMPNKYTVHFDANGGRGEMEDILLTYDQAANLPLNQFTRNNEYGDSTFLGWNIAADTREVMYQDGAEVMNMTELDGSILTLYAVWDDCPWILAEDLYYTLNEAQNGEITYDELMSRAVAEDREDGSNIVPGTDAERGTSFTIVDYQETDFTQFKQDGSVTETYQVIDSAGNKYKQMITVYVVDTASVEIKPEGTTRFIDEKYYSESFENGGLEEDSIWKINTEYIETIQDAFQNSRNDTPIWVFEFSHEEMEQMKSFIETNGIGNFNNEGALQRFYDEFMVPNMVN